MRCMLLQSSLERNRNFHFSRSVTFVYNVYFEKWWDFLRKYLTSFPKIPYFRKLICYFWKYKQKDLKSLFLFSLYFTSCFVQYFKTNCQHEKTFAVKFYQVPKMYQLVPLLWCFTLQHFQGKTFEGSNN